MAEIEGILGRKLGMTQIFDEEGNLEAVTAIEAGPCFVSQVKTQARDGYNAVQLGFGETKRLNSPEKGHLKGVGRQLKHLRELRVNEPLSVEVGQGVDVSIFKKGERVDITGISKGKGFAGVVKRHHFAGGPKSHGQSDRHRAPGSVGSTTFPGRVLKGTRMAGHMGNRRVNVRNLKVLQVDPGRNLLLVKGAVPGAINELLVIKKSTKGGSNAASGS
jgi:large subunit ribosomal protein L3